MNPSHLPNYLSDSDVAIIGLAGRFPGAKDIDAFWQNLQDGVESITFFSEEELEAARVEPALLKNLNYVKANGIMPDVDLFDASFFGFSAQEAELMDPQERLFLECAWEALENSGYNPEEYQGAIAVYAGMLAGTRTYLLNNIYSNPELVQLLGDLQLGIANEKDFLATRVAYKLNLKGHCVSVQTACSTSLVAVHLAVQSLLNGECDMALAGGVSIHVPQKSGYLYGEGMMLSPDGHCRAFDAGARGTVISDGVGVVLLKRLAEAFEDGDCIQAIIRGSAINNDGSVKIGYTAPSVDRQAAVISKAQGIASIPAETISYVEAHGTGTVLGDTIEIAALTKAFRNTTQKKGFCAIGSLKTNVGHMDSAAGVAGLIKTVLALKHGLLPPSLNFEEPNPKIDFENSPFYVNDRLSEWKSNGTPRRAGVSSFGIGGTNAHVVLEEAPKRETSRSTRPKQLLVISAKTSSALETATANLAEYLKEQLEKNTSINLADVAYTLSVGRSAFSHRRILVCSDLEDAAVGANGRMPGGQAPPTPLLDEKRVFSRIQESLKRPVAFLFSGQGAQYVNMARDLQIEPSFRSALDRCSEILKPHLGLDLREVLYPDKEASEAAEQLKQTAIAQPALFAIEYALSQLWMSWGIRPVAAIGHSIGEYVAACIAGVFSLEDALALVAARGKLMQQCEPGAMLAVSLTENEILPRLNSELSLGVINGVSKCVISGPIPAIDALENELTEETVNCRRLHVSHAFHSQMMEPILDAFTERVKQVRLDAPKIPYISNVTGNWITAAEATDPSYWAKHLRQTVRFAEGLEKLLQEPEQILLEVGPGKTLTTLAIQHPNKAPEQLTISSLRHPKDCQQDEAFLLTALGNLWLAGANVDWSGFYADEQRYRLPLPTYPFERQSYWIEPKNVSASVSYGEDKKSDLAESLYIPSWKSSITSAGQGAFIDGTRSTRQENTTDRVKVEIEEGDTRDDVEIELAKIWETLLDRPVGVKDNFFELGGDSILAARLFVQIEKQFGKNFALATLFEAPTVEQLASIVRKEESSVGSSCLVPIKPNGSKPPLFCIHPIGGNILSYQDLARHLDPDRPVYGLQSQGASKKQAPLTRVEDMASLYIEEIQTVFSHEPYFIAGYSFGGLVAFEMARQLYDRNQKVGIVALLDTACPTFIYNPSLLDFVRIHLSNLWQLAPKDKLAYILNRVKWHAKQKRQIGNKIGENNYQHYADTLPSEVKKYILNVFEANLIARKDYNPKIYNGNVTLFRCEEQSPKYYRSRDLGWSKLADGGLNIQDVSGFHDVLMVEPNVRLLATKLNNCLDKAVAELDNM